MFRRAAYQTGDVELGLAGELSLICNSQECKQVLPYGKNLLLFYSLVVLLRLPIVGLYSLMEFKVNLMF